MLTLVNLSGPRPSSQEHKQNIYESKFRHLPAVCPSQRVLQAAGTQAKKFWWNLWVFPCGWGWCIRLCQAFIPLTCSAGGGAEHGITLSILEMQAYKQSLWIWVYVPPFSASLLMLYHHALKCRRQLQLRVYHGLTPASKQMPGPYSRLLSPPPAELGRESKD